MHCQSKAGKTFLLISVFFGVLAIVMRVISESDGLGVMLLFLAVALLTGVPGWLLCSSANRSQLNMQQQMQQFIQKNKRFYMPELARFLGLHEEQARLNVLKLIQQDTINLVYDSDADLYGYPETMEDDGIIESCTKCNGRILVSKHIGNRDARCPFCATQRVQYSTH